MSKIIFVFTIVLCAGFFNAYSSHTPSQAPDVVRSGNDLSRPAQDEGALVLQRERAFTRMLVPFVKRVRNLPLTNGDQVGDESVLSDASCLKKQCKENMLLTKPMAIAVKNEFYRNHCTSVKSFFSQVKGFHQVQKLSVCPEGQFLVVSLFVKANGCTLNLQSKYSSGEVEALRAIKHAKKLCPQKGNVGNMEPLSLDNDGRGDELIIRSFIQEFDSLNICSVDKKQ